MAPILRWFEDNRAARTLEDQILDAAAGAARTELDAAVTL